ncbi:hypothetical protein PCE1_000341 [Barthelona sp. PCE]
MSNPHKNHKKGFEKRRKSALIESPVSSSMKDFKNLRGGSTDSCEAIPYTSTPFSNEVEEFSLKAEDGSFEDKSFEVQKHTDKSYYNVSKFASHYRLYSTSLRIAVFCGYLPVSMKETKLFALLSENLMVSVKNVEIGQIDYAPNDIRKYAYVTFQSLDEAQLAIEHKYIHHGKWIINICPIIFHPILGMWENRVYMRGSFVIHNKPAAMEVALKAMGIVSIVAIFFHSSYHDIAYIHLGSTEEANKLFDLELPDTITERFNTAEPSPIDLKNVLPSIAPYNFPLDANGNVDYKLKLADIGYLCALREPMNQVRDQYHVRFNYRKSFIASMVQRFGLTVDVIPYLSLDGSVTIFCEGYDVMSFVVYEALRGVNSRHGTYNSGNSSAQSSAPSSPILSGQKRKVDDMLFVAPWLSLKQLLKYLMFNPPVQMTIKLGFQFRRPYNLQPEVFINKLSVNQTDVSERFSDYPVFDTREIAHTLQMLLLKFFSDDAYVWVCPDKLTVYIVTVKQRMLAEWMVESHLMNLRDPDLTKHFFNFRIDAVPFNVLNVFPEWDPLTVSVYTDNPNFSHSYSRSVESYRFLFIRLNYVQPTDPLDVDIMNAWAITCRVRKEAQKLIRILSIRYNYEPIELFSFCKLTVWLSISEIADLSILKNVNVRIFNNIDYYEIPVDSPLGKDIMDRDFIVSGLYRDFLMFRKNFDVCFNICQKVFTTSFFMNYGSSIGNFSAFSRSLSGKYGITVKYRVQPHFAEYFLFGSKKCVNEALSELKTLFKSRRVVFKYPATYNSRELLLKYMSILSKSYFVSRTPFIVFSSSFSGTLNIDLLEKLPYSHNESYVQTFQLVTYSESFFNEENLESMMAIIEDDKGKKVPTCAFNLCNQHYLTQALPSFVNTIKNYLLARIGKFRVFTFNFHGNSSNFFTFLLYKESFEEIKDMYESLNSLHCFAEVINLPEKEELNIIDGNSILHQFFGSKQGEFHLSSFVANGQQNHYLVCGLYNRCLECLLYMNTFPVVFPLVIDRELYSFVPQFEFNSVVYSEESTFTIINSKPITSNLLLEENVFQLFIQHFKHIFDDNVFLPCVRKYLIVNSVDILQMVFDCFPIDMQNPEILLFDSLTECLTALQHVKEKENNWGYHFNQLDLLCLDQFLHSIPDAFFSDFLTEHLVVLELSIILFDPLMIYRGESALLNDEDDERDCDWEYKLDMNFLRQPTCNHQTITCNVDSAYICCY